MSNKIVDKLEIEQRYINFAKQKENNDSLVPESVTDIGDAVLVRWSNETSSYISKI